MGRPKGKSLTRADVVAAAVELVRGQGAQALGIQSLSRALKIKAPSLYHHVGNGAAIRDAVAAAGWTRLKQGLAVAGVDDDLEGVERVVALAKAYRAFASTEPELYSVMSSATVDTKLSSEFASMVFKALEPVNVSAKATRASSTAIHAAVHGFVHMQLNGRIAAAPETDATFQAMIRSLIS